MKLARAIPVFMYHHVSPSPGLVTVSPETFRSQMEALCRAGWKTVGLNELANFLSGQPLPDRTCILTFDDGYLDNYVYAHPVLAEFGMKAVLFLITGWIGTGHHRSLTAMPPTSHAQCMAAVREGRFSDVMLHWSEVEKMTRAGTFEFHSHTHTHQRWDLTIPDTVERISRLRDDLLNSRLSLEKNLGIVSPHLCWPQGFYDGTYQQCAHGVGFDYLYTTEKALVKKGIDPLAIGRIVTKDRPGAWITHRASIYASPLLGGLYVKAQKLKLSGAKSCHKSPKK